MSVALLSPVQVMPAAGTSPALYYLAEFQDFSLLTVKSTPFPLLTVPSQRIDSTVLGFVL